MAAVRQAMGDAPEAVKRELEAQLREQVEASVAAKGGVAEDGSVGVESVRAALAEMDAPEEFGEAAGEGVGVAAAGEGTGKVKKKGRWGCLGGALLGLLVGGLAGLWVGEYVGWTLRGQWPDKESLDDALEAVAEGALPGSKAVREEPKPQEEHARVLRLRAVDLMDWDEGVSTLALRFSAAVSEESVREHVRLRDEEGQEVGYRVLPQGGNGVWLETDTSMSDQLVLAVSAGMESVEEEVEPGARAECVVRIGKSLLLEKAEGRMSAFAEGEISLRFDKVVGASGKVEPWISVEPAAKWRAESDWSRVVLRGDFREGKVYTVKLSKGLPGNSPGVQLRKDEVVAVAMPLRPDAIRIDAPGRVLGLEGGRRVPVRVAGPSGQRVKVELTPIREETLAEFAARREMPPSWWEGDGALGEEGWELTGSSVCATQSLAGASAGDRDTRRAEVDVAAAWGGSAAVGGLYLARFSLLGGAGPGDAEGDTLGKDERLVSLTDLGVSARLWEGGGLAWVNRLRSGKGAEGVSVKVWSQGRGMLASGVTDGDGVARLEWKAGSAAKDGPCLITATDGAGDLAYLRLEDNEVAEDGDAAEGEAYLQEGECEAAVWTERGIYRPGETMLAEALVRDGRHEAPSELFPVELRLVGPDGRVAKRVTAMPDATGHVRAELATDVAWKTGKWRLEAGIPKGKSLGRADFSLEDFVPPQMRVEVEPALEGEWAPLSEGRVGFRVRGAYLYGRAANGAPAKYGWSAVDEAFEPKGWEGWLFGDSQKQMERVFKAAGEERLNEDGHGFATAKLDKAWKPSGRLRVTMEATVLETGGRPATGRATARVEAYPFHVGLRRTREGAVPAGAEDAVQVVEVGPDGKGVAEGKPLTAELLEVTWNVLMRKTAGGRYEWVCEREERTVARGAVAAGGEPTEWRYTVPSAGSYEVVVRDEEGGASARISLYAGDGESGFGAWRRERPGRALLTWTGDGTAEAGGEAEFTIEAPFAGRALVTVESDRVLWSEVRELDGTRATWRVPVPVSSAPNLYVCATVVRPAGPEKVWSVHRAVGTATLGVRHERHQLGVEVECAERMEPASPLRVRVKTGGGAGVKVSLAAVDEAICGLTGHKAQDPNARFFGKRAHGVRAYDPYASLIPETNDVAGTAIAGGDDWRFGGRRLNPVKGKRFKPVALWSKTLTTGDDGSAEATLDVPEFSGELRVMAVAWDAVRAGAGEAKTTVRRDWTAILSLPRFLADGDSCDADVALWNAGPGERELSVDVSATGPLTVDSGLWRVRLGPGKSTNVTVKVSAPEGRNGLGTVRVAASDGAGLAEERIELPVRPAGGAAVEWRRLSLGPGEEASAEAPGDWFADSVWADVTVSSGVSVQMGKALADLVWYPHGCCEQTVSGALPFVGAREWAGRLAPSRKGVGDIDGRVKAAVQRVVTMQRGYSGGFGWWPGGNETDEFVSCYAMEFLLAARRAGYAVPEEAVAAGVRWLRRGAAEGMSADREGRYDGDRLRMAAWRCRLLAESGAADRAWLARLEELEAKMPASARAELAGGLIAAGEAGKAAGVLERVPDGWTSGAPAGGPGEGDVRTAARLLSAWADLDPESAEAAALAERLRAAQDSGGSWGTTHDNAVALAAFGKLAAKLPERETPLDVRVETEDGAATWSVKGTNQAARAFSPEHGGQGVTLRNRGQGRAWATVRFEGVGHKIEEAKSEGIAVGVFWHAPDGREIDPGTARQGDLLVADVFVRSDSGIEGQMVLECLLPAGWEPENPALGASKSVKWRPEGRQGEVDHTEMRDDRVWMYGDVPGPLGAHYGFVVRAVTPGDYAMPGVTAELMYRPEVRGRTAGGRVRVVP